LSDLAESMRGSNCYTLFKVKTLLLAMHHGDDWDQRWILLLCQNKHI